MIFLFPNDIFNPKQPDEAYRDRVLAFKRVKAYAETNPDAPN